MYCGRSWQGCSWCGLAGLSSSGGKAQSASAQLVQAILHGARRLNMLLHGDISHVGTIESLLERVHSNISMCGEVGCKSLWDVELLLEVPTMMLC
jgi:hypothetical protein